MRRNNRTCWVGILVVLGCLWGTSVWAMPVTIGYVGQIENSNGSAFTGATIPMLHVGLYDGKTATAKVVYGMCNYANLPVTNGVFFIEIGGAECPATPNVIDLLASGIPLYVGFEVGGAALLPYQPLVPVPYALIAMEALDASQLGGKSPDSYASVDWVNQTFATKSSLSGYMTTAAANMTFATKDSLSAYMTTTTANQTFETKAYAEQTYATKDALAACCATSNPCAGKANGTPCDDANPCTTESTCQNEVCKPTAGTNAPNGTVCEDGNKCLTDKKCTNGFCSGVSVNCNDNNACTADACSPSIGCFYTFMGATTVCSDNNVCTSDDKCIAGICIGSPVPAATYDDANPCTVDSCDPIGGPKHVPDTGKPCNNNNACDTNDQCGACQAGDTSCVVAACYPTGPNVVCDDNNPCTTNTCVPASGCQYPEITAPPGDPVCSDNNACTNQDACKNGICVGVTINCNDNNTCTADSCVSSSGCSYQLLTGTPCNDGNPCTVGETCDQGVCKAGPSATATDCNDGNPCTKDSCDPSFGCINLPDPGLPCDDGNKCTEPDLCDGDGNCVPGPAVVCVDTQCTDFECTPAIGCSVKKFLTGPCNDGQFCTTDDTCTQGVCAGVYSPSVCTANAGNPCMLDNCDPNIAPGQGGNSKGACTASTISGPCDDKLFCTENDFCVSGKCQGTPVQCAGPNITNPALCGATQCDTECVSNVCSEATKGCAPVYGNIGKTCEDGNPCTFGDSCDGAGHCTGADKPCPSANPCIDKICNPADGSCLNKPPKPDGTPCEDGNQCTVGDVCQDGTCKSGGLPIECIDGNICTIDGCNPFPGTGPLCVWVEDPIHQGKPCVTKAGVTGICIGMICATP